MDGPALAGGTELVLACDLVVASTTAVFGIPEVKRNLVAAAGGLFRLPARSRATSRWSSRSPAGSTSPPSAPTTSGSSTASPPRARRSTRPWRSLSRSCQAAPLAAREPRKIVLEATDRPDDVGWRMSAEGMATAMSSEDFSEGLIAFIEKRAAGLEGQVGRPLRPGQVLRPGSGAPTSLR